MTTEKAKATPASRAVQAIVAGRCDDELMDVATAIALRLKESAITFAWRFRMDGLEVGELEVTLDEWSRIQKEAGVHWTSINPEGNVDQILAIGSVLLSSRTEMTPGEAKARVGALTLPEIPDVITREQTPAPLGSAT